MNIQTRSPSIGDNVRPALITAEQLALDFAHFEKLVADLAARGNDSPPVLEDDEDLTIAQKLVVDCRAEIDKLERAREAEKRPYLDAGRVVDGYFKTLTARLDRMKTAINERATRYLTKKADAERAAREAEARRLNDAAAVAAKAAADAAAAAPKATDAAPQMAEAARAHDIANEATVAAAAKPADLARTRTDTGTATLIDDWQFEVTNYAEIDLNKLRAHMSRPDVEKAIRRHVTINKDAEPLAGIRIFNKPKARMA